MKKVLLVLLAVFLFNCDKDEQDCKCDVKVIIVDGEVGITGSYTITNVPSDCEGNVDWQTLRQDKPANHWFNGTTNCD
jgi:hypothetical protein